MKPVLHTLQQESTDNHAAFQIRNESSHSHSDDMVKMVLATAGHDINSTTAHVTDDELGELTSAMFIAIAALGADVKYTAALL